MASQKHPDPLRFKRNPERLGKSKYPRATFEPAKTVKPRTPLEMLTGRREKPTTVQQERERAKRELEKVVTVEEKIEIEKETPTVMPRISRPPKFYVKNYDYQQERTTTTKTTQPTPIKYYLYY